MVIEKERLYFGENSWYNGETGIGEFHRGEREDYYEKADYKKMYDGMSGCCTVCDT